MPRKKDNQSADEVLAAWKDACKSFLGLVSDDISKLDSQTLNVAISEIEGVQRLSSKLSKKMLIMLRDRVMKGEITNENEQSERGETSRIFKIKL